MSSCRQFFSFCNLSPTTLFWFLLEFVAVELVFLFCNLCRVLEKGAMNEDDNVPVEVGSSP